MKKSKNITKTYLKDLVYQVVGSAIDVHKALGPGLLESAYQKCLEQELKMRDINFKAQFGIPIVYKGFKLKHKYRCDFLIENILVVELKAVENMHPLFDAQLLTYMKLLEVPEGLLINFNVCHIYSEGQKTMVNELYRKIPE